MKALIITLISVLVVNSFSFRLRYVPQGLKLKDHFGLPTVENVYGPKTDNIAQYVEANPETFTPMRYTGNAGIKKSLQFKHYDGYEQKLTPHTIKSGDMTNLAPSASKIISPQIAGPKLQVNTKIQYPAIVGVPTFKGMKKEWHNVTAYNKVTGEIVHDKVLISKPLIVRQDGVTNIERDHTQVIDLKTGARIEPVAETKKFFGTERN
jgi:hypothetical protein